MASCALPGPVLAWPALPFHRAFKRYVVTPGRAGPGRKVRSGQVRAYGGKASREYLAAVSEIYSTLCPSVRVVSPDLDSLHFTSFHAVSRSALMPHSYVVDRASRGASSAAARGHGMTLIFGRIAGLDVESGKF